MFRAGVERGGVAAAGDGRAGVGQPGLRPAVQQRGHPGVRAGLLRPVAAAPALLPQRPEVCHLHPALRAHLRAPRAGAAPNDVGGAPEAQGQAGQEGLKRLELLPF